MPLTPDDVVTKQFQHVRFKEGFDPDEVDDFLDEIVVEWRAALAENERLKARIAELESGSADASTTTVESTEAVSEPVEAETVTEAEPVAAPVAAVPVAATAGASTDAQPAAASAGIIELAQRLHDEHVAEGKAQRDQLISDAQTQAATIISDAEAKGRDEIERLDKERNSLESRITELRQFERDYRAQLRSYIEGKLRDLDSSATPSGQTPAAASQ